MTVTLVTVTVVEVMTVAVVVLMISGIVAMVNVFQQAMFVMAHLNSVTQAGVLTVLMVQMKV
jgi:hypothetical protein